MSAEILRRAAALMRQRAEAALVEPWRNDFGCVTSDVAGYGIALVCEPLRRTDAEHIASWHPAVALTAADLLEVIARDLGTSSIAYHAALTVASAYLGEQS